jgi:apolipoprotein N-acyltransferase
MTDPYDQPAPWWSRHEQEVWAAAVFALTALLTVASFPPRHGAEFAYAFAAPAIFWAYTRPSLKLYAGAIFAAQAVAWFVLLFWLRHVTWAGPILLGPFIGIWVGVWYLAVWWAMPRIVGRPVPVRLAVQLGLAALWVLIEWTRTWFLGGFPWLPLAASQVNLTPGNQSVVLQIAAYTGAGGVSFVLIVFNIGFAAYAHRLFREGEVGFRRRSQEFFLALFLLLACLCVLLTDTFGRRQFERPLGRVTFIQPYIPQSEKWDPAEAPQIVQILRNSAQIAATQVPDLVLWPEAVTPWAIQGDPTMRSFVEWMARTAKAPMLMGSTAIEQDASGRERYFNAVFAIDPTLGVQPDYYAKRKLVPFGEYVPWRFLFGWLKKFVPIGDDFTAGRQPLPLAIHPRTGAAEAGVLVCYEDVFPQLARDTTIAGADFLAVLTNDAWYGEEDAAYQHAAHSVLRAIEMRRPVLRCGNGGWSGWIDEYGFVRGSLTGDNGSVYYRGVKTLDVQRDSRWIGHLSFFARYGDWFIVLCAFLSVFAYYLLSAKPPAKAG